MRTRKISPPLLDQRHTAYVSCGRQSTPAKQAMQRMLALSAITTPSVAACGATTVWANGPIAPPLSVSILKQLRNNATKTIGCLDMETMHVGSLADKIN
jgi:hypothetical protein